jgi:hypothetical protein
MLCLLIPVVSALDPTNEMSEMKIEVLQIPGSIRINDFGYFSGQLSYADGTELK